MARKPKLDTVLAEAVDAARMALAEIAPDAEVGEYIGAEVEGERLVTHRFVSQRDGYRGWTWFVTLARVPRAKVKDATVCELGIIPGEGALLAPAGVPWAERLAQEEIEAAQQATEQSETADAAQTTGQAAAATPGQEDAEENGENPGAEGEVTTSGPETAEADEESAEPARRQVRRRRTAQRTAARRRAAARNRARKTTD